QRHVSDDPATDRRKHLVPGDDQRCLRLSVLHRAPLRSGILPCGAAPKQDPAFPIPFCPTPMTERMVKAESVPKRFGQLEVLKGIDLEVKRGEVMCMLGPSGSGKSTFLRCINHLEKINAGRLYVDGELVGYRESGGKLYELHERDVASKRSEIG